MESDFIQSNLEKLKEDAQNIEDATEINELLNYLFKGLKEDSVIATLKSIEPKKTNTFNLTLYNSYVTAEIGSLYPRNLGWEIKSNRTIAIPAINVAEFFYSNKSVYPETCFIKNIRKRILPKLEIDDLWFTSNFKPYITQMELSNLDELLIDTEIPSKIRYKYAHRVIKQTKPRFPIY